LTTFNSFLCSSSPLLSLCGEVIFVMRLASASTLRALRQRSPLAQRRFASSSTEQAQKKAQETLASAQKQAEKAWEAASKYMGPLGERIGSMLGGTSLL
jgi:hypothetical protein